MLSHRITLTDCTQSRAKLHLLAFSPNLLKTNPVTHPPNTPLLRHPMVAYGVWSPVSPLLQVSKPSFDCRCVPGGLWRVDISAY